MRALGPLVVSFLAASGCGPAVEQDPVQEDWMVGAFSEFRELPWEEQPTLAVRYELHADGSGQVVRVDCDETALPATWTEQQDGSVRLEYSQDSRLIAVVLTPPRCDGDGFASYPGERRTRDSADSPTEGVSDLLLFRSSPCPGDFISGEDCENDDNECDSRGHCAVTWCDGGEPQRCGQ